MIQVIAIVIGTATLIFASLDYSKSTSPLFCGIDQRMGAAANNDGHHHHDTNFPRLHTNEWLYDATLTLRPPPGKRGRPYTIIKFSTALIASRVIRTIPWDNVRYSKMDNRTEQSPMQSPRKYRTASHGEYRGEETATMIMVTVRRVVISTSETKSPTGTNHFTQQPTPQLFLQGLGIQTLPSRTVCTPSFSVACRIKLIL
jgi:hypothetical protein